MSGVCRKGIKKPFWKCKTQWVHPSHTSASHLVIPFRSTLSCPAPNLSLNEKMAAVHLRPSGTEAGHPPVCQRTVVGDNQSLSRIKRDKTGVTGCPSGTRALWGAQMRMHWPKNTHYTLRDTHIFTQTHSHTHRIYTQLLNSNTYCINWNHFRCVHTNMHSHTFQHLELHQV